MLLPALQEVLLSCSVVRKLALLYNCLCVSNILPLVFLGYSYYHFSGAKKAVDAGKATKAYFEQTAQSIKEKASKSPNEVINFLRSVSKTYLGVIPGASSYVDTTFDTLDELQETHGDEVNKILTETFNDVQAIVKDSKSTELEKAKKLWDVLGKRVIQLQELSKKAGVDAFAKLEEKHPQMAKTLGSGYRNLKELADRSGPEAKKLYDETSQQVRKCSRIYEVWMMSDASLLFYTAEGDLLQGKLAGSLRPSTRPRSI